MVLSCLDNLLREVKATLVLVAQSHLRLLSIVAYAFEKVAGGIVRQIGWPLCHLKEVASETIHGVGMVRSIARGKRCHVLNFKYN